MPTFRLDKEPWIPVVNLRGESHEISLTEIFQQAPNVASLNGSPLEIASILRLLLAIGQLASAPKDFHAWTGLWSNREKFLCDCVEYIRSHEVWDLFDDGRPFLQDPRLRGGTVSGREVKPATIEPVEPTFLNRGKLGTDCFVWHAAGEEIALTPAQAARALLVTHSFAVGGTGTPNPLIPKANSGQDDKYSKSSLLAQTVVVYAHTSPLDKVLLLNLMAGARVGTPGWEWPPVSSRDAVACTGIADRYSRPTTAILLNPDKDGLVRSAAVTIGTTFPPDDVLDDPMLPLIKVKDGYRPLRLDRSRALWRSSHILLAELDRPLAVVAQLRKLASRSLLPDETASLRLVGIGGEPGKVKHFLWRDEVLPLGSEVLIDPEHDQVARARYDTLLKALRAAELEQNRLRSKLVRFARVYLGLESEQFTEGQADGGEEEAVIPTGELSGYGRKKEEAEKVRAFLGNLVGFEKQKRGKDTVTVPLFENFWSRLAPAGDRIACDDFDEARWAELLKEESEHAFHRAISQLPPDARRFRAEYARRQERGQEKQKQGATA